MGRCAFEDRGSDSDGRIWKCRLVGGGILGYVAWFAVVGGYGFQSATADMVLGGDCLLEIGRFVKRANAARKGAGGP